MPKCRFFPYCSYIEDHGCTDDWCKHYQPIPDVDMLFKLADEIDMLAIRLSLGDTVIRSKDIYEYARMIRDAVSVGDES